MKSHLFQITAGETDLSVTETASETAVLLISPPLSMKMQIVVKKLTGDTQTGLKYKVILIFFKPVNHADDAQPDRYDSTEKNLESISACVHQVQLADDQQRSTA